MNLTRKQKIILIVVAIVVVVLLGLAALLGGKDEEKELPPVGDTSGEYYDANSGQTVSDPEWKTPDTYGTNTDAPIFLGISDLIDNGLTQYHASDFEYAITQYHVSKNIKAKEVSVTVDSIKTTHDPAADFDISNFDIMVDRKDKYHVKLELEGLTTIRMFLYDTSGKLIYESGNVTNQSV